MLCSTFSTVYMFEKYEITPLAPFKYVVRSSLSYILSLIRL